MATFHITVRVYDVLRADRPGATFASHAQKACQSKMCREAEERPEPREDVPQRIRAVS